MGHIPNLRSLSFGKSSEFFFQKSQIQLMDLVAFRPPKAAGAPRFLDVRSGEPSELAEIAGLRSARLVGALIYVVISVWIRWLSGIIFLAAAV